VHLCACSIPPFTIELWGVVVVVRRRREDLEPLVWFRSHMICHMLIVELQTSVFNKSSRVLQVQPFCHSPCQLSTTWLTTWNDCHMAAVTTRNYHHLNHPCLTTTTNNNDNDHHNDDDHDHEVTITTTTTRPPSPQCATTTSTARTGVHDAAHRQQEDGCTEAWGMPTFFLIFLLTTHFRMTRRGHPLITLFFVQNPDMEYTPSLLLPCHHHPPRTKRKAEGSAMSQKAVVQSTTS
jgi:hypothetical protein